MNGSLSPWQYAKHLRRNEVQITFGISARQILSANPNRIGVIISSPTQLLTTSGADSAVASAVDTSTTGVKLSKAVSSSSIRTLASATFQETAATGVVAQLELVRSSVTYALARFTTSGQYSPGMPMVPSDTLQWNVITAQPASTADFTINLAQTQGSQRVTLSVNSSPTDGNGVVLNANQPPLVLWKDVVGDSLTEDLYGIASISGLQIGIWDLFY